MGEINMAQTAPDCGHEGIKYLVRDDSSYESVICVDCIADEIETLRQGVAVHWTIMRVDDEEWGPDSAQEQLERGPR